MDSLHLPEIVKFRERSGRYLGSVNNDITQHERLALTGRRQTNSREKRRTTGENISTKKKRTSKDNRERKTSLKKTANTGKSIQTKTLNTRKQFENIGLPKITTNNEDTLKSNEACGMKKTRRTKANKGDTISYVYSKSLQDENTMAFIRNNVDFERDFNVNYKDKRSSFDHKKPYGLPALKSSEEHNQMGEILNRELDFSDASETESLLNAWEAIDDEASSDTTSAYNSTDCSTGNND